MREAGGGCQAEKERATDVEREREREEERKDECGVVQKPEL